MSRPLRIAVCRFGIDPTTTPDLKPETVRQYTERRRGELNHAACVRRYAARAQAAIGILKRPLDF